MTLTVNRTATLGGRVRAARLFAGIEQIPIATELGVSRQTISSWETGRSEMPAWALIRWAELTRVSFEWLGFGSDVRPEGFEPPAYCSVADDKHWTTASCDDGNHALCQLWWCECGCHASLDQLEQRDLVLAA